MDIEREKIMSAQTYIKKREELENELKKSNKKDKKNHSIINKIDMCAFFISFAAFSSFIFLKTPADYYSQLNNGEFVLFVIMVFLSSLAVSIIVAILIGGLGCLFLSFLDKKNTHFITSIEKELKNLKEEQLEKDLKKRYHIVSFSRASENTADVELENGDKYQVTYEFNNKTGVSTIVKALKNYESELEQFTVAEDDSESTPVDVIESLKNVE